MIISLYKIYEFNTEVSNIEKYTEQSKLCNYANKRFECIISNYGIETSNFLRNEVNKRGLDWRD